MSDQKKFDEFLQQSFGDYAPEVPPHIWENVAAEKRKKRPVAFWLNKRNLLMLGAMLLITGGAGVLLFQKNDAQHISLENNSNNSKQVVEKATSPAVIKDATVVNAENMNTTTPVDGTKGGKPQPIMNDNNNANDKMDAATAVNNGVKQKAINNLGENSLAADDKLKAGNVNNLFRNKNNSRQRSRSKTRMFQTIAVADGIDINSDNEGVADKNDPEQHEFLIPALQNSKEKISLAALTRLIQQPTVFKAIKIPDCPAAEKNAAGNKSYVEVYAGPDYAFKKYSDTGNSVLVEKRKESLRFQSAFSAGFRYTKVFNNGMSIRAGINYSQINEKFSFIKDNVVQLVYVINTNGDTTDSYYVRGTRYKTSYNHYRTIDVPLVVGYEMGNDRLHANINAGVMINVYSWQSGETLDNNYMPVNITTGKEGNAAYQYKTNVGLGFTGAVSLYYKLNDRLHLLAEPYCRFNLSPMNKEAVSLQEKFTTVGLRLGLRVDLQ